jgi:BirA family transcriptional regulator, biotin operon repressor / biotin---[acetyl-CoA-carboxylase] ligase
LLDIDLIEKELLNNTFISEIYYFEEIDSTNSFAKSLAGKDNIMVIAEYQKSGKGRYERIWESEKGNNLTFSIKKTFELNHDDIPSINFYFSYFVYETIKDYLEENNISASLLNIKWPNDILYDNKKLCGVLIESNIEKHEFTIGIGINLNQQKFNPEYNATSIKNIINHTVDVSSFLAGLIFKIDKNLGLLSPVNNILYTKWKNASNLIGKSVVFNSMDNLNKYGNVIDLQRNGGIKLLINGEEIVYYSGDIKITLIGN